MRLQIDPMFMMPTFTFAVGSSIGVGFASATVLKAMSNAAGIKGFIGLASLLHASANDRARPSFPVAYHMGVKAIARYPTNHASKQTTAKPGF
jgi:hypothetical protein